MINLLIAGYTNKDLAKTFNVSERTINRRRKELGFTDDYVRLKKYGLLTNDQLDIIEGSLLGKGIIEGNRFKLNQPIRKKEYLDWVKDKLNITGSYYLTDRHWRLCTVSHPNIKQLPNDFVLNENKLVHWVIQSGYSINKQFFLTSKFNIEYLSQCLKNINIQCNIKNEKIVISESFNELMEILRNKIIWECYKYKIKKPKTPSNKLNRAKAKSIRKKYSSDNDIKKIANEYKVSCQTIYNIINNITYKQTDFSKISLIYNPH